MSVQPDVGAVVIGRNEGARLERCLRSLVGRVAPVVYVDSGSSDGSVERARALGVHVVELDLSRRFTAARARNEGLGALCGIAPELAFVQFVDADCEVVEGWIETAREALRKDETIGVVCGRRRERHPEASIYNRLCDIEWDTPVGRASACGGDAMMRIEAVASVGAYDEALIAGEEPELCYRLRAQDWEVRRLDAEMTLHDAAMTSFAQWWRRAVRAGHAAAEGAWLHGRSGEQYNVRRVARAIGWGAGLPLATLMLTALFGPIFLLVLLAYPAQWWRIAHSQRAKGLSSREARLYALFTVIDKFPALIGAVRFAIGLVTGRSSGIIEYKAAPNRDSKPAIAYIAPVLPALSETFVYREIFALREMGVRVVPVTVRAPATTFADDRLEELRREALIVYEQPWSTTVRAGLEEACSHPASSLATLAMVTGDVISAKGLDARRRGKVFVQGLASLALAHRLRAMAVRRIHAHFAHVPTTIAMYAARQLGIPFSFTGHANDLFRERTLLDRKLRRADVVACISEWHRDFYRRHAPMPSDRMPVIRCGVDTSEFAPGQQAPSPTQLLGVGRLVEKKGFNVLVRAIAVLREQGVDVTCRIVGDGPQREVLASLIEELDLADRVELHEALPNDLVRELMQQAGLFVLACVEDSRGDRDGIPVVLMEAMATGVCVVSGDLPAIRELVVNGRTGVMVRPGDVDELAGAIASLVREPSRAAQLGLQGREWVRREFSKEENVGRLMKAFGLAEQEAHAKTLSRAA